MSFPPLIHPPAAVTSTGLVALCREFLKTDGKGILAIHEKQVAGLVPLVLAARLPDWDFYLPRALRRPHSEQFSHGTTLRWIATYFAALHAQNAAYYELDNHGWERWRKGAASCVEIFQDMAEDDNFPGIQYRASRQNFSDALADIPHKEDRLNIIFGLAERENDLWAFLCNEVRDKFDIWRMTTQNAAKLAVEFPQFEDWALKRAQLFLATIGLNFQARGEKVDFDLTAFADYQLPRIFVVAGALTYRRRLAGWVNAQTPLNANSREETAIRAATIVLADTLLREARRYNQELHMGHVDAALWMGAKAIPEDVLPFHLTRWSGVDAFPYY